MKTFKGKRVLWGTLIILSLVLIIVVPLWGGRDVINATELPGSYLINFHQIDSGVYRSDQPSAASFRVLEEYGIKEIISLRYFHDNAKDIAGTSLISHHIPMHTHNISEEKLIEAMRVIKNRKGPILIHCFHGSDRAGAVSAMYEMTFQHKPVEEAIESMRNGGYGHHKIFYNIPRVLRKIDIDKVRRELDIP